ncbi:MULTISPECIES: hypothetical protein [Rhizobium]|uniref:Uncharacterized protein n=1 Tax=Rhizobium esperanzae TaxID=1967781 RepID=A0A7W6UPA2_9HYPH|nr:MULTISPECIES: hypothetical protein [Rhizobium]MBB4441765.1 hypothetical protein [Rhizobium esperanzae]MDH6204730.1 hypothetical protein [Rhizobium leguminosarum]
MTSTTRKLRRRGRWRPATEQMRMAMGMKVVENVTAFFEGSDVPHRLV